MVKVGNIVRNSDKAVVTVKMGAQRVTLRTVFDNKKKAQAYARQYNIDHPGANARARSLNGYVK